MLGICFQIVVKFLNVIFYECLFGVSNLMYLHRQT